MTAKSLHTEKKYFFNQNIFDEGHADDGTTPLYTAKDLEEARKRGFNEGRTQATKDQEDSRAHRLELTLNQVKEQISGLLAAEKTRGDYYEREMMNLVLLALKKLFPLYEKNNGFEELKNYLAETLKNQEERPRINLFVSPEIVNEIKDYIGDLKSVGSEVDCQVTGDEKLIGNACVLSWSDGGTIRNSEKLLADIETSLQDLLAARSAKVHDKKQEDNGDNS